MKKRIGFVSNSSSSSFVVSIPEGWIVNEDNEDLVVSIAGDMFEEGIEASQIVNFFREDVAKVLSGRPFYYQDELKCGSALSEVCQSEGFVLTQLDTSSDQGQIVNVTQSKMDEIYANYLKKMEEV